MGRFARSALIGVALVLPLSAGALAADLPEIPPYVPPPVEVGGGWYLRGHIGMAAQHFDGLQHPLIDEAMATDDIFNWVDKGNFDAVPTFGLGIGYRHNDHLRFDLTGEYRGKASFSALDYYDVDTGVGGDDGSNNYTAKKSELTFLVNGYYDIGTWHGVTPYLGGGIGMSYNTIDDFRDTNTPTGTHSLCGKRVRVELRLGAACRSRHPGHRQPDGGPRVQLYQSRQRADRDPDGPSRTLQYYLRTRDVQEPLFARLQARRALRLRHGSQVLRPGRRQILIHRLRGTTNGAACHPAGGVVVSWSSRPR